MKAGRLIVSDELLCLLLGLGKKAVIVNVKRSDSYIATEITIVHPKLPDLLEGAIPPPIRVEDLK